MYTTYFSLTDTDAEQQNDATTLSSFPSDNPLPLRRPIERQHCNARPTDDGHTIRFS